MNETTLRKWSKFAGQFSTEQWLEFCENKEFLAAVLVDFPTCQRLIRESTLLKELSKD